MAHVLGDFTSNVAHVLVDFTSNVAHIIGYPLLTHHYTNKLSMYLRRKIDKYLVDWHNTPGHKPLLIKGARQVGKSESIRHFAHKHFGNVIEINFVSQPAFKSVIENGFEVAAIVKNISMMMPQAHFVPGDTLIFFDEVQDFPEIATALKFFMIDSKYDVICSGSMLGVNYKRIHSVSVGYKVDYEMFSMDFEEFLWAKGYDEGFVSEMYSHIVLREPFGNLRHGLLLEMFRDHCVLGGLPEVVSLYIANGHFGGVLPLQQQLLIDYRDDIRKYVEGLEQTRILNVFNRVPVQLAQDNKKFQISKVAHNAKSKDYWGCVEWLADAGLINICYCLNFPELPLKGNYDSSKYKLYFADTGMLIASLDDEAQTDLRLNKNLGTYKGAIYENVVADALRKSGAPLFYYKRDDSSLEEDFFMRTADSLVPVEVKATGGSAQSLRTLISSPKYQDISWGIKLSMSDIACSNNILVLPYYCAFLLKRYLASL